MSLKTKILDALIAKDHDEPVGNLDRLDGVGDDAKDDDRRSFRIGDRILTTTAWGQESGRVVEDRDIKGLAGDFATLVFTLDTPGVHRDLSPRTMGEIHLTADRTWVLNDAHAITLLESAETPIGHIDHNRVTECDECGKCTACHECRCYDFEWPIDPDDRMAPMSAPCAVALAAAREALLIGVR
jgi:hypothetical protein